MSGLHGALGLWPPGRGRLARGSATDNALETSLRDSQFHRVSCGARDAPLRAGETPALQDPRRGIQLSYLRRQDPG